MSSSWTAYVDESIRPNAGVYLLAAACVDDAEVAEVRTTVTQLGRPNRRFHWRDEEPPDRLKAVALVADLPALHLVVVAAPIDPRRQERARRHCLRRLLYELGEAGVRSVWLEARAPALNRRDVEAVDAFRAASDLSSAIVIGHVRPAAEPLLWIPDIVAGAVGGELDRREPYAERLAAVITRYRVEM